MLVLASIKADPTVKEQSCKRGGIGAKGASDINIIFALLEGVLGGLRVWDDWLQPGGTNLHRSVRESLVSRSPQEHLNRCAQTGAWRGVSARARAWCHRCGAEFGIV